jgi:hypothetical protein
VLESINYAACIKHQFYFIAIIKESHFMTTIKPTILISMISALLLLGACGGDDADTTSAPAPAPAAASAPAPAASSEGEALSMDNIEKAEGVVYQDEIYANWPYN